MWPLKDVVRLREGWSAPFFQLGCVPGVQQDLAALLRAQITDGECSLHLGTSISPMPGTLYSLLLELSCAVVRLASLQLQHQFTTGAAQGRTEMSMKNYQYEG